MSKEVSFIVPGVPVAQPRAKATSFGGRTRMYTPTKTSTGRSNGIAEFKATVRLAAQQAYQGPPLEGPIALDWCAVFPRPPRLKWKKKPMPRERHTSRPDRDNVEKAIMDALKGIVWVDDCQVCDGTPQKWIAAGDEQPHVSVTIRQL